MHKFMACIFMYIASTGCCKFMEKKNTITLDNRSTLTLYNTVGMPGDGNAGIYPDTSLPNRRPSFFTADPHSTGYVVYGTDKIESIFEHQLPHDTLSVYVFNAADIDKLGWDIVQKENKVLKRYDLSLQDLQQCGFVITYDR